MPIVYLDTNIFILALETPGVIARPARDLLSSLARRPQTAITSELTLAALLAPFSRVGGLHQDERRELYTDALTTRGIVDLAPVSRAILMATANVRSAALQDNRKLKLPDAVHIATAVATGCRFFLSSDRRLGSFSHGLEYLGSSETDFELVLSALDA